MTSKEWVKNELSLSDDCLTTTDRIMLNKILQDLEYLRQLKKENQNLKDNIKLANYTGCDISEELFDTLEKVDKYKNTYNDLYNDIIKVIQEIKDLTMEVDTNTNNKDSEEVFKTIKNLGWNEAVDIISTKLAVRMSIHILNKIKIEEGNSDKNLNKN